MDIFGIGASELLFILIIAIIVLGPRDMQKAGRTIGRWLNYFIRSDGWKALQRASHEIRRIPTTLMREANLDMQDLTEIDQELRRTIDPRPTSPPALRSAPGRTPPPASRPLDPPAAAQADETPIDRQDE